LSQPTALMAQPLLYAAINFVGTWAVLAFLWHLLGCTRGDGVNASSYRQLSTLFDDLQVQHDHLGRQDAGRAEPAPLMRAIMGKHLEACKERLHPEAAPGWVVGSDYVSLWERIHRAEEALVYVEPEDRVLEHARYDLDRCTDSTIPDHALLQKRLQ